MTSRPAVGAARTRRDEPISRPTVHPARPFVGESDRATLERWVRAGTTPQRTVLRARIILQLAEGLSARAVARRLDISRHTVDLWRKRYLDNGIDALPRDRPGRGRKPRS